MRDDEQDHVNRISDYRRVFSIIVVILNVIFLSLAVALFTRYGAAYQKRLREENLGNIANLNQSAAMNATSLIGNWKIKLDDIVRYSDRHQLTHEELLVFLDDLNSNEDRYFELVGNDYNGYLARKDENDCFQTVSYAESSYEDLQRVLDDTTDTATDDICFTPEFTESTTALKFFAIYRHMSLEDDSHISKTYTLLLASRSEGVLAVFNSQNEFEGQSSVLIDQNGNYIVSNRDFKSDNFFRYLYIYNDLSLDEQNEIKNIVNDRQQGELYYRDASGQDCVFRYERMETNDWFCVTSVPITSFRNPAFSLSYTVHSVLLLLMLLVVDVIWLRNVNHRLKVGMKREKEASNAKTEFLSRMSHDIRTPLNGITGLTLLALEEPTSPTVSEYLENIKISGQFLTGLVNDILEMSRVESGKVELHPEPYTNRELHKYVEAVAVPLCRDKGLEFQMSEQNNELPVYLDRLRFHQIIFNLLSNAVKYTPSGGKVELYCERTTVNPNRVALKYEVRDNGIGMSEEFKNHMFESFSQENPQLASNGAGLGLTIVNSLVKLMDGRIEVESIQGKGSVFTVYLETELCREQSGVLEEKEAESLEGKKILLCEDNQINVMVAQKILMKWGMEVTVASNGRIGVDTFCTSEPYTFHAILMDIMMPELNGLDATKEIRMSDRPDAQSIRIIAMTANAYDTDVKKCYEAGMNAYIAKPIDVSCLHKTLLEQIK